MSDDDTAKYYHYTDKKSAKKIEESGLIRKSIKDPTDDDAKYGDGVYTTTMTPSNKPRDIATNNYDDKSKLINTKLKEGKVESVVEVEMSRNKMVPTNSKRDVHLYKDKDLDLNGKDVKAWKVYDIKKNN